ncbi:MAG: DUF4276 family protein [Chitinophagales bacterium]|nr:DUF4276 family protein [Chitinophagales bacterium]
MNELKYTLISDGQSDMILMNVINWLLNDLYPQLPISGRFANFSNILEPPKSHEVLRRIDVAFEYFPFDILFYHRDAESSERGIIEKRKQEITSKIKESKFLERTVCVVPVRMMESWLLFDVEAIKGAAGNRNFKGKIALPLLKNVENVPDTKSMLHDLLKEVSGLKGRNLKKFNANFAVHLIAENIEDFSPLRQLNSFKIFENQLRNAVDKLISK